MDHDAIIVVELCLVKLILKQQYHHYNLYNLDHVSISHLVFFLSMLKPLPKNCHRYLQANNTNLQELIYVLIIRSFILYKIYIYYFYNHNI